ncbi:hypothetical protein BJV74DRAFT_859866 [Russula compacta]|nr:hypothetical protein BJV74DRAFT_859866 [Russula compacta]
MMPGQPPKNLQQYRREQASKINEVINLGFALSEVPREPLSDATALLYEFLRRFKIPRALHCPNPNRQILVRVKYEEAEQAILLASMDYCDAFIVAGNPGIGSPRFPSFICRTLFSDSPQRYKLGPSSRPSSTKVEVISQFSLLENIDAW